MAFFAKYGESLLELAPELLLESTFESFESRPKFPTFTNRPKSSQISAAISSYNELKNYIN